MNGSKKCQTQSLKKERDPPGNIENAINIDEDNCCTIHNLDICAVTGPVIVLAGDSVCVPTHLLAVTLGEIETDPIHAPLAPFTSVFLALVLRGSQTGKNLLIFGHCQICPSPPPPRLVSLTSMRHFFLDKKKYSWKKCS